MKNEDLNETVKNVQELLKGEISAIETYDQVIEKFQGKTEASALKEMRDEHRNSERTLRALASHRGEVPEKSSGVWGSWAQFTTGAAKLFGQAAALKALKEGEEHGIKEYEDAIKNPSIDEKVKSEIEMKLLPAQRKHIVALDQMISRH